MQVRFRTAALVRSPAIIAVAISSMRSVGRVLEYKYASHTAICAMVLANLGMLFLVRKWERGERALFLGRQPRLHVQ